MLIRDSKFGGFHEELGKLVKKGRKFTHLFLITDSEDQFAEMRSALGRKYTCVQLYRSYLENFRINTAKEFLGS